MFLNDEEFKKACADHTAGTICFLRGETGELGYGRLRCDMAH